MNSREKIMEATRQAMQEWKEAHAGAEFADMDARMAYINSRVMELTTEETREAAETGEDATEETEETIAPAEEHNTMKKQIAEISMLTGDLYYDYVQPAAIAAGITEEVPAHHDTWGDYTAYHVDADAADEIGHCMYCACMNAHIALHQYGSEAEARQMLYQLEVSIKYHPETAETITALRNAIAAMLPQEAQQEAPAADAQTPDTDTEEEEEDQTMNYTITLNEAFNSLEITFTGKPSEAVRDALKALKFRWHGVKKLWYGYTDEETARAAIDNAGTEAAPVAKVPTPVIDKAELRRQFEKAWDSPKMVNYCVKKVAAVATLPSGEIITIDRQSIETRFCFGESGYDYDEAADMAQYARTSEDYFKRENMKHFADLLHAIDEAADIMGHAPRLVIYTGGAYTGQAADCALRNFGFAKLCDVIEACGGSCHLEELPGRELVICGQPCRIATAEELSIIRAAVQSAAAAHEKRVETYLKRYGTSKVHTWTYWRDA